MASICRHDSYLEHYAPRNGYQQGSKLSAISDQSLPPLHSFQPNDFFVIFINTIDFSPVICLAADQMNSLLENACSPTVQKDQHLARDRRRLDLNDSQCKDCLLCSFGVAGVIVVAVAVVASVVIVKTGVVAAAAVAAVVAAAFVAVDVVVVFAGSKRQSKDLGRQNHLLQSRQDSDHHRYRYRRLRDLACQSRDLKNEST